ncbi:hypothetical protein Nepgr_031508 [Nepenthes gracilis]|uniref:Uncharacterized protein n=1 Tax=Nepenthes gracilis TaxID=150966 RepID=A0AAD3THJ0_NEPGR|nr:hypothetical protein Nepgr_031508 [Nepenthes gracilis]
MHPAIASGLTVTWVDKANPMRPRSMKDLSGLSDGKLHEYERAEINQTPHGNKENCDRAISSAFSGEILRLMRGQLPTKKNQPEKQETFEVDEVIQKTPSSWRPELSVSFSKQSTNSPPPYITIASHLCLQFKS